MQNSLNTDTAYIRNLGVGELDSVHSRPWPVNIVGQGSRLKAKSNSELQILYEGKSKKMLGSTAAKQVRVSTTVIY